ncbi:ATP-dependent endonuclease [Brenneria goodwinii]|uniref:ATP-dependent endonuclease n=1 Tax=Brenneria goodwinii TaxID=1109412 RepID=A0A0G4K1S3_9GAMM|nr:ATP-dependent endonuclease [Brenneria goodwinii]ATA24299.1 ATP-dependent endonuclease [Brenneria goodwinii]MCG8155047.1 ATP-dependent endonuclease [Brenneria goodwinii]MCG8159291.1 ATP-dependent endonuclease [Brenneria goodwinii]MCG8164540.1 ATP-dependent endonuclease [Brenneria goodwinii]MCG8168894.1 ATP-dependent endonuclease [Brenneria goodwinii]
MYLENVEVLGFRGINRLSLTLDDNTVLIGENAWGKSSLLDALSLLLSPTLPLYHFDLQDFHFTPGDETSREHHLQVIFTFCETAPGHHLAPRYRSLDRVWVEGSASLHRIFYRLEGEVDESQSVCTWRSFLDAEGHPIPLDDIDELAREVIRLHPVLRLRDARFMRHLRSGTLDATVENSNEKLAHQFEKLMFELAQNPQKLSDKNLRQGLAAMRQLLEHYFSEQNSILRERHNHKRSRSYNGKSWRALDNINRLIAGPNSRSRRIILLGLFSTLLQAKGPVVLDPHARPLLLIEDPETRLHPIMLSVAWGLLMQLPLQKITTTNSGELLSLVPMEQVCRLVRESSRVATYRIGRQGMSAEDSRRIAFHIRFNRPSALFARCWLLVEGETEVWMLSELARQCGHHFEAEGVKVIEFAQSGLRPLLKFAQRMGIEWHVLVDGDDAGKKYAAMAQSLLAAQGERERDHLTVLPALDMEHYMYREGFGHVYHRVAQLPEKVPLSMHKIIVKAIHRSSKPDLAIEVAMEAAAMGGESIPLLLRGMFSRVLWLARGRAD